MGARYVVTQVFTEKSGKEFFLSWKNFPCVQIICVRNKSNLGWFYNDAQSTFFDLVSLILFNGLNSYEYTWKAFVYTHRLPSGVQYCSAV
jgi:hypothetical protein